MRSAINNMEEAPEDLPAAAAEQAVDITLALGEGERRRKRFHRIFQSESSQSSQ